MAGQDCNTGTPVRVFQAALDIQATYCACSLAAAAASPHPLRLTRVDVVRLEIQVHHAALVHVIQSSRHLRHDAATTHTIKQSA